MTVTATPYGLAALALAKGEINLASDVLKLLLIDADYTPNIDTHATTADLGTNEITGEGYTAGGQAITNLALTYDTTGNTVILTGDPVEWTEATFTSVRYAVINDTAANKLLGYIDFGENKTSSGAAFKVKWSADGILNLPLLT